MKPIRHSPLHAHAFSCVRSFFETLEQKERDTRLMWVSRERNRREFEFRRGLFAAAGEYTSRRVLCTGR